MIFVKAKSTITDQYGCERFIENEVYKCVEELDEYNMLILIDETEQPVRVNSIDFITDKED